MKNYNDIYDYKETAGRLIDTVYSKGYDKGYADCIENNEFKGDQLIEEAYQKGLDDAWRVQKIITHDLTDDEFNEIFRLKERTHVCRAMTATQAIAKIKEYEEKQKADDEIRVGDEVMVDKRRMLVLGIDSRGWKQLWCPSTGFVHDNILTSEMTKTGRHFDIQSLLDRMKEEK